MRILILGGTVFLGRALVEAALARGHHLTLFNRGKSNPDLFLRVEQLHGDRATDLHPLQGRHWDAVIDTCGYVPRIVRLSAEGLAPAAGHYTFISSLSVYADTSQPGVDESAPVGTLQDETVEQVTGETYGPLKALCERAVEQSMPGRALVIRPGLIVGPYDPTDRFTYWPVRVARGGDVLAGEMRVELADEGLDIVPDDFGAERFLAREVIVEGPLGHADLLHELLNPGPVIALLHQQQDALVQQLSTYLFHVTAAHGQTI